MNFAQPKAQTLNQQFAKKLFSLIRQNEGLLLQYINSSCDLNLPVFLCEDTKSDLRVHISK